MKLIHLLCLIVLLGLSFKVKGQSFELPMYFEDAAGQKDTIVVGYDISGSNGIDPALGEEDILGNAYTNPLEVRAAIYDYYTEWPLLPRIMESKKDAPDGMYVVTIKLHTGEVVSKKVLKSGS